MIFRPNKSYRWTTVMAFKSQTTTVATMTIMASDTQLNRTQFAWISVIILICILSMSLLIGWKHIGNHKWNQFNSNPIEYKSNHHSDDNDEPLVQCDSFIIDDSFTTTLINQVDMDNDSHDGKSGSHLKTKSKSKEASSEKPKNTHNSNKIKIGSGKNCDEFSERRCLTDDDEQFDFSMQFNK